MTTFTMSRFVTAWSDDGAAAPHGYEYRLCPPGLAPEFGELDGTTRRVDGPLEDSDVRAMRQWQRALFSLRRVLAGEF